MQEKRFWNKVVLDPGCRLLIVGHYPGKMEVRFREPFVGPSGRSLVSLLCMAGVPGSSNLWVELARGYRSGSAHNSWNAAFRGKVAIVNVRRAGRRSSGLVRAKNSREFVEDITGNAPDRRILVLGRSAAEFTGLKDKKVGSFHEGQGFLWHHPDPRSSAAFWGGPHPQRNRQFQNILNWLGEF